MPRESVSPAAALFDAAVYPGREEELAGEGLEVVAAPGMRAPLRSGPGLMAVRRARGEGRLAILAAVERIVPGRGSLEAEGVFCEGFGEGFFAELAAGPGGRRTALRIAGPDGVMAGDTVLLRPGRGAASSAGWPGAAEDEPAALALLLAAVYALRARARRTVREEYLRSLLEAAAGTPPLQAELQRAAGEVDRQRAALPAGADRAAALQRVVDEAAATLLAAAERHFILDPQRSTLELLEPAARDLYLPFRWHAHDFPGGPEGPNEARARRMFAALTRLRPERRANQGAEAVVRRDEFDDAMQARVRAGLTPVAGEAGQRLQRDAAAAFARMRTAAAAEGVTLSIRASYRDPQRAAAAAARAANPTAVASFSSHSLGLAVDLTVSHGSLRFQEVSTRPFQNLVDMYRSPVHKWMFLRGEPFGWFPYRPEPWHWEYNPPGFRETFRRPPQGDAPPPPAREAEGIDDPIAPPRAALSIRGAVGRGARNAPADVRAVQDRLVELRALDAAAAAAERPAAGAAPAESALARTIEAIDTFQRRMGLPVSGKVLARSPTRRDLDRAIPHPTAAELAAVTAARDGLQLEARRGITLRGGVGAGAANAPDDVRAVQRRLVDLGMLRAAHGEEPPATSTDAAPVARLRATIAGLRRFQGSVQFWKGRRVVSGAITPGAVAPGDATARLLERVSVYVSGTGAQRISFHDHVRSGVTEAESGVRYLGSAPPSAMSLADYRSMGLTADQAAALKQVSESEGQLDAINTYDRARVSVGFIQFAGGRGLPPYLALLKARLPAKFGDLLRRFGIDVEFAVSSGAITGARVVVLQPQTAQVLRGEAAEAAIREDKKLTLALILSGRDRDVQLVQLEAAARGYVLPALRGTVSWAPGRRATLGELLRTQKGMAALFDRAIQEGVATGQRRFERIIRRLAGSADPAAAPPTLAALQAREADVLAELERDLQAAAEVARRIEAAGAALTALIDAARAAGAAVAGVLGRAELQTARQEVAAARRRLADVVNVGTGSGASVDATIASMSTALQAEESRLAMTPSPSSVAALTTALTASRDALAAAARPVSTADRFLGRVRAIRSSRLDSGLAEVA